MKFKKIILITMLSLFSFSFSTYAKTYINIEQFINSYNSIIGQGQIKIDDYKNVKSIITQDQACDIIKLKFDIKLSCGKGVLVDTKWAIDALLKVKNEFKKQGIIEIKIEDDSIKNDIVNTVSEKLSDINIDKKSLYNEIKTMLSGLNDQYTVFFPPTEATNFNEELEGEYQGIGAYVDMSKPGELIITSPIAGSPAERAGIRAGDRVIKIDNRIVTEKVDLQTAVSWIKGPEGTNVQVMIMRTKNNKSRALTMNIKRESITVKNINSKVYDNNICYMNIAMFGYSVYSEFVENLDKAFANKCKEYIFDVRNNPGGSLDEVAKILSYFVPTGKPSVIIKSNASDQSMLAEDASPKLNKKNMIILQNQYSASASEIFAGTIKDYVANAKVIGEKSFGKGSVQELIEYTDGSMLKYTVAKWYTGGSKKSIDKIGLSPDIKVVDDPKTIEDEQLQYALKYKFGN